MDGPLPAVRVLFRSLCVDVSWVDGADVVSEFDLSGKPLPWLSETLPVASGLVFLGD